MVIDYFLQLDDLNRFCGNTPVYYSSMIFFNWHANGGNNCALITSQSIKCLTSQILNKINKISSDEVTFIIDFELLNYAKVLSHSGSSDTEFLSILSNNKVKLIFLFPQDNGALSNIIKRYSPHNSNPKSKIFKEFCKKVIKNKDQELEIYSGGWQGISINSPNIESRIFDQLEAVVNNRIKRIVFDSIVEGENLNPVSSSYIKATHRFSARRIYSNPNELFWITLKLGKFYFELLDTYRDKTSFTFLSGSFRGTPLAVLTKTLVESITQNIPPVYIEIVDRLGPIFNITEGHDCNDSNKRCNYIYFADFCMGGTELKLAESLILSRNGVLFATFALGSYLKKYNNKMILNRIVSFSDYDPKIRFSLVKGD